MGIKDRIGYNVSTITQSCKDTWKTDNFLNSLYNPFVNPVHRSLFTNIRKDITHKKYTETLEIRALVGWARNSGSCPAQVPSLCFSIKQSDPQTRGTNGTAGVRNGDSPALSVSPGAHSSRKATMNILNPFKASARRSHRVYPSSRCVSDREMLWMRRLRVTQPTGESTLSTTCI